MKRVLSILLITLMLGLQFPFAAFAQISNEEIENYLSPLGWTTVELENYLKEYGMSLNDFTSFEELKEWIGTPITEENRLNLLNQYNMSFEELKVLLAENAETPEDYFFVEDLDAAIHFYTSFSDEFNEVTDFFAQLGISDEELEKVFLHLSKLDEETVENQMAALEARISAMGDFSDVTELTETQKEETEAIFTEMLAIFRMSAKFYLESNGQREPLSLSALFEMENLNGNKLIIELYDDEGNVLLDMMVDENIFNSGFLSELAGNLELTPNLAHEHPFGEKMPETASPYVQNVLIGLFLLFIAVTLYIRLWLMEIKNAS